METNKIKCPDCGLVIVLKPKQENEYRLVAFHNCEGKGLRCVYETDAPTDKPVTISDRLNESENVLVYKKRR